MSTVELTGAGAVRAARRHLAEAGLEPTDRNVVALLNRLPAAVAAREQRVDLLHTVFGVPAAVRGDT